MSKSTIAEFVSRLKNLDVQLSIDGEETFLEKTRLRCSAPDGILTPELRQELIDRKTELILYLSQERGEERKEIFSPLIPSPARMFSKISVEPPNTPIETQSSPLIPLSFAQQRLWFLYQLAPDNPFYNVPAAIRLSGTLDQRALARSFQEIVRRHAALRTTFTTVDGEPIQVISSEIKVQLAVVNWQAVDVNEREQISQQLATAEAQRPFNLTTDPLLRVTLLQFGLTESVLLLTMHHIVADGWSLGVLIRELACCYTALVERRSPVLPSLPLQYTDFARWQRQTLQGEVLAKQLAYWRKQLQHLTVLELPRDRPRPAVQTYRGATRSLHISPTLTRSLMRLGQQSGVSLFMILLAT
ncbi:MAG TPA: condensation domain-containing protein, partial [Allocoleopsis sp.]